MAEIEGKFNVVWIVGVVVVLANILVDKLMEESKLSALLWSVGLTVTTIILTILICRVRLDFIVKSFSEKTSDEVRKIVEERLGAHARIMEELSIEASNAALQLQLINPGKALRKILLTKEDICRIEGDTKDKIYVVTRDLAFDQQIESTVVHNLRNGIEYFYFFPGDVISTRDIQDLMLRLGNNPEELRHLKFVSVPIIEFNFPMDVVLYDPQKPTRHGYVRLPSEDLLGGVRAINLRSSDHLMYVYESLNQLRKRYPEVNVPRGNHEGRHRPNST